ncbi:MAG: DUF1294 domain-containing protein [Schwartzia sp.]|nr:DUF1294 domain-containing protein [Schwartzia sp. (in: firmicutes)]
MSDAHTFYVACWLLLNAATLAVYDWDKLCAKRRWWRVPEKTLLLLALLGGSLGALAAMAFFRHKTLHLKFRYGVPLILIVQVAGLFYLHTRQ